MSLQKIYDDLNNALSDGVIVLSAATAPDLGLTLEAIGITGNGTLTLTGATLALGPRSVVLTGNAIYRDFAWATTLTGEPITTLTGENGNRFTLAMQAQDASTPWTFGTSFPNLRQSRVIAADLTLRLVDSVLSPLVVEQPLMSVTTEPPRPEEVFKPSLQGWLVLTGSALAEYIVYFAAPKLYLGGEIDFSDPAHPEFVLKAAAPGANFKIDVISISEVGIKLQSDVYNPLSLDGVDITSVAEVYANISFGKTTQIAAEITAPLLQGNFVWQLDAEFDKPITATTGFALILDFFGQPATNLYLFPFPLVDSLLRNFGVESVGVGIQPPLDGQTLSLQNASIALTSVETWNPSLAFVTVTELGASWMYHWETDPEDDWVAGNVWGKLTFFDDPTLQIEPLDDLCSSNKIELVLTASVPDWVIEAENEGDICVPLGALLKQYFGGSGGLPDNLRITDVSLQAQPLKQTYHASLMVEGVWETPITEQVKFIIDRVIGEIFVTQNKVFGGMTAKVSLPIVENGVEKKKATFDINAEYRPDGIWHFEGLLAAGPLSLVDFVIALLGSKPSFDLPEVLLTDLALIYETSIGPTDNLYSARGTLEVRWKPEALGVTLSAVASAYVERRPKQSTSDSLVLLASPKRGDADNVDIIYVGELSGIFTINRLTVRISLSYADKNPVYVFEVTFDKVTVRAATEYVKNTRSLPPGGTHPTLVITLRGLTLGDVVTYLIRLANPNQNYQLDTPWTFLNSIDLSNFQARIDPKEQTIAITYRVNLTLPFIKLDTVGVLYDRSSGEGKVNFILTGDFLGKKYDPAKPLAWDAVNDPPPAVPGKGVSLVDLRYLGAGQHVTLSGLTTYKSVTEVLKKLREEMQPITDPKKNPLEQSAIKFDASSQWMFGIDITLMRTVTASIVLHDPDLYGLVLSLAGPSAGSLAGLSFELLYKKVTNDIGVFRVRLQVPDAFRQIQLGAVSITLGIITVDVFTNGNFLVDLGFPHNKNFTNSFGLEAGIFIGRGGIYFGLLDGSTSTRVPAITNGQFSPVLELGIGLAVGVGRTYEKGPLKAGLYVQLVAIIEGVLAWFHPTDESKPNAMYYWVQGSAGLLGKLYGSVDFKVIKVSVSVEAHAIVTFTYASYRATLVELNVRVSVKARVKVLFVTVTKSFSLTIKTSFTIGKNSTTPWILSSNQSGRSAPRLIANESVPRRRRPADVSALTRQVFLLEGAANFSWPKDIKVFPDGLVHPVAIKMLPSYTIDQVAVKWPNEPEPSNTTPAYRINFLLMADSGVPPDADTIAEAQKLTTAHLASADDISNIPFNVLIDAMFRWSVAAIGTDPVTGIVSLGLLEELALQLDKPETAASLDMGTLSNFFKFNLEMLVSGIPSGKPHDSSGTLFPIPPPLGWDSSTTPSEERRFATYQPIDSTYEAEVKEYFAKLEPNPKSPEIAQAHRVAITEGDPAESIATFVFRDYFLLIAKAAVQSAISVMEEFPYNVSGENNESLSSIAALFPPVKVPYIVREGDTVDQVADAFGMSSSEILALNPNLQTELNETDPGEKISVWIGVTPESIAAGNPSWPLNPNVAIALGDIPYQVGDGESLQKIANKFGSNADTWLQDPNLLAQLNLLQSRAPLTYQASSFLNPDNIKLGLVAAFFYIRINGTNNLGIPEDEEGVPLIDWYVQTIGMFNEIHVDGPLPSSVYVPEGFDNLNKITWTTQPGDTVWTIAAMFALYQNQTGNDAYADWLAEVLKANPNSNPDSVLSRVLLPEFPTEIQPGEVLESVANRFPVEISITSGQWLNAAASFREVVKGQEILAPLVPITVPDCHVKTASEETISSFAGLYDLALEDLGARVATVGGLLARWPDNTLTVPHPASAPIGSGTSSPADLVPVILRDFGGSIAGQTSRYLIAGLRMPAPIFEDGKYHAKGPLTGLYELTGQQLTGPNPPDECEPPPEPTVRLELTVKNYDPDATWLKFYGSTTLTGEETFSENHLRLNPGLKQQNKSKRGLVALIEPVDELTMSITDVDLCENYPSPVLKQEFITPPAARPLFRKVPVRHALQQQIVWQTTENIVIPNPDNVTMPATGMPTLWPFSGDLMRAEIRNPTTAFALCNVDPQLGPSAEPQVLTLYAWATIIDIRIRSIPGLSNTYEVFGADTAGRQLMLELWKYLDEKPDAATLHILYQQSVSTGQPNGLTSVPVTNDATYIIKTNLTTETQSGLQSNAALDTPPTFGDYYARLADSRRFLTLMWECSVVGGGGYWLQYTSSNGEGLPQSIFSSDGTATISLLVLLDSQMRTENPDRELRPFNNTALVGNSIDASASNLFARVANLSEQTKEATVDPGNIAFFTSLKSPPPNTDPPDKQIAIRQLYGMIAYELSETIAFKGSSASMAVGPQVPNEEPDEETWDLFQVVPIWRYARSYPLPDVDGLPAPDLDPYAGITAASSSNAWTMANTNIRLSFRDVYGNNSPLTGDKASGGPDVIDVKVGYTDPMIGIGAWPATTAYFTVRPQQGQSGALLATSIALQASTHLPAGMQRTSDSSETAAKQLSDFTKIYYQLAQKDVSYSLSTTLDVVNGEPRALATSGSLLGFVAGTCAWLTTAIQLGNVFVDIALASNLDEVSENYGVGYEGLAAANGDVPLNRIFKAPEDSVATGKKPFAIPVFATFPEGGTIAGITPQGSDPVQVLSHDQNTSLPLRSGTEFVIPPQNYVVPADPPSPEPPPTLTEIAETKNITIASLITANEATHSLLREGFTFICEGVEVFITAEHPDVTLIDVALTFQEKGINYDAVMVAGANAHHPGMFRAGAVLAIDRYIIKTEETVSNNGTGSTAEQLAPLNTHVANLFYSGTAIYLSSFAPGSAFDDPLDAVATTYALSADQLLRFNREVELEAVPVAPDDQLYLAIPGHAVLPPSPLSLNIPYRIPGNATLDGIAALFLDATALSLAQWNEQLPGVLAGGKTISVAGQNVVTTDGESFAQLLAQFNPAVTLQQIVTAIEATPGYLKAGALLLTTLATLPASPAEQTPHDVATRYGLDVTDFAVANSGLANIVVPNVTLISPTDPEKTIKTGAADTFVSLVWRFSQQHGIQTTVADVVKTNSDRAFIKGGATILLAPAPATLTAPFGVNGWQFPSAIFDVHAFVEIKRQRELVDPEFRDTPAAYNVASIPAVPKNDGTGADSYLALQKFAEEVKDAIPVLRIATGKVLADDREQTSTDVWGVAFGSGYIAGVKIAPGVNTPDGGKIPRYFALRPLENALVARNGVPIRPLHADGRLDVKPQLNDFQGVDMETWAQRFLADVDLFLSAPYAAAAYQTPKRQTIESVLGSKDALAGGIAAGLDYILDFKQLDPSVASPPPLDWNSAVESLRQLLLANLSAGYDIDAVVQYDAETSSPWTTPYAKLNGPGKLIEPGPNDPRIDDEPQPSQQRATLSSAKTSLTTTPQGQPSYVNFLFEVGEEGQKRTARLNLSYPINEVEFNIKEIVDGYNASDWLTLVLNNDLPSQVEIDLGKPDVPLPVRSYPPLPTLLGQTATPTLEAPTGYAQAMQWDYSFAYMHQSLAVDQIWLEVEFNQTPLLAAARALDEVDLFAALAQYNNVAPQLWDILKLLPEYPKAGDKTTIDNAMETFAGLVGSVATAWSSYWSSGNVVAQRKASTAGPQPERYTFKQTLVAELDPLLDKWFYKALVLERDVAEGSVDWPEMAVFINDERRPLVKGVEIDRRMRYDFPEGVEAFNMLALEMRFVGLGIANYQNASSRLQVVRNAELSPLAPTRSAFVYQTQWFSFPSLVSPLLSWREPFPIGTWTTDPATNPLGPVFNTLFGSATDNRTISCGIRYGYELATSDDGKIVPYLPVKFRPKFTYDPDIATGTVSQIIEAVQSWYQQQHPVDTGGEWLIGLNLYSSVDGQLDRPLLELPVFSTLV